MHGVAFAVQTSREYGFNRKRISYGGTGSHLVIGPHLLNCEVWNHAFVVLVIHVSSADFVHRCLQVLYH